MRLALIFATTVALSSMAHAQSDPAGDAAYDPQVAQAQHMEITRDIMDSHMQHLSNLQDARVRNFEILRKTYKAWRENHIQLQGLIAKGVIGDSNGDALQPYNDAISKLESKVSSVSSQLQSELQYFEDGHQQFQGALSTMKKSIQAEIAKMQNQTTTAAQQEKVDAMMAHAKQVFGSLRPHEAEGLRRKFHHIARHARRAKH